jgi:predicted transcriptional regulator of viral defense system
MEANKMQYVQLKESLKDFTVFSLNDIRRIDNTFHRRRLNEWQDKGYIKKVVKGYYIFSDLELNENVLFEIANRIYSPSYISFEMGLFYYHLIPESVYGITSASSRRTYKFKTPIAEFSYKTIKPELFFGYNIIRYDNKYFKIASPEKAVLDYFYINSHLKKESDFASLRINRDMFSEQIKTKRLRAFLKKFGQKTLKNRMNSFLEFLSAERRV